MTGRRLALLIAVDTYTNPGLRQLRAPSVDAEKLAEVLRDETLGGFTVAISSNQTAQAIAERIEDLLADLGADDTALVHFAGHGLRSDEGELYLAGENTRPERLSTTGVDMRLVSRLIRRSRAGSVILLLDCCYGAAFAKGVVARAGDKIDISSSFPLEELPQGRGHVVITAARETEFAVESGGVVDSAYRGSSLFTAALIQGIASGEADADGDGLISVNELYEFIYKQVRAARPQQTPNKWEFGVRGGLFISYSPRRRVRPAPLPAYVAELVNSDKYTFHQVAVQELLHLVEGDDVALAAAARAALRDLTNDDSRKVSAAALAALDSTAIRLLATEVDLGILGGRAGRRPAEVKVTGGPLALASSVVPSPGVRARIVDDVLRVAITESRPGPVDTIVRVTGPAGEAELRVRGYVATAPRDAARAAAKLAREDIGEPFQQALVLTAAAWAAHVTADAESVMALLADAEAAAQHVHDSRLHFMALTATNLLAARCGDDQRAGRVIGNLASLIHVAIPDPMGRALLLAGLGLFGRLVAPAKARECHPGVATIGRAIRWATAEINESQRVEALFDDARDAARATASPAERAQAELGVSWLSSLSGKTSPVPLSAQLAAVVLTSGAEPDAMATLLLSVMLLDAASSTPMTSLVARPDDGRFLVSTGKDLFHLATARQPIGGGHRYMISESEALRKQLNRSYRPIRYILEAAFYHRSGNKQASADRLKLALAGDAELPEITPTALIIVAAIQHATGDDAAARATLLSADAAAARIGDPDLLTVQLWLGCVVARLAGADDIARQLAIAAEAVADRDTPDERPLSLALAALCAETAGAPNTAILERATSGLDDMDDVELQAFARVLITWTSRPRADADWSRQLFDGLVQFVDVADIPLRCVIVLLAAFSAAGRDVRIPGAELFDALFGFHEDAQHARKLLTEARAAAAGSDDAERLPTTACLALAAHTLGDRGLRTELLRETADLLGLWPSLPWLPWLARLAVAWLSMLDGDLQAVPTTLNALLSYARDADNPLEAASLQLAAALTQALTGQLDEAQQTLVAAHTTIDRITEPAQAKSLVLAAAAWVGALAQSA